MSCERVALGDGMTAIDCTRGQRGQPCATCGRPASIQAFEKFGLFGVRYSR